MPGFTLHDTHTDANLEALRDLIREYAVGLGVDLCFQDIEQELRGLPGAYAKPAGVLVAAYADKVLAGCCALRPLDNSDYPNAAEMKRLYVRAAFRGMGLGRLLAETVLDHARASGYESVLLDTLSDMEAARALYEDLGFVEVPPYYHNPIGGSHYLRVRL
jgi:putative acetyltransferase